MQPVPISILDMIPTYSASCACVSMSDHIRKGESPDNDEEGIEPYISIKFAFVTVDTATVIFFVSGILLRCSCFMVFP